MNTTRSFIVTSDATTPSIPRQEPRGNESPELLFALYAGMAVYHFLNRGVSYREQGKLKSKALPFHAAAGVIEVLLYYSGLQCSIFAVAACFTHSITGLMLVKNLRKGYSVITRPSYQAGSILRPIAMCLAYCSQNRSHYHDALVPIHAFVYTRVFFFLLGTIGPSTEFSKNVNSKYVYLLAISGGALISIGHCHNVWALPLYLVTWHAVGKLNFWTRVQVNLARKSQSNDELLVRTLCSIGLCMLPMASDEAMQISVNDGPKIGNLPADSLGHVWARKA